MTERPLSGHPRIASLLRATACAGAIAVPLATPANAQVEKEFGVRNLSCPAKVMTASELPDAGTYRCAVSDGRDDSALKDVTLVVTADNKVGLYDNQGKEMK